MNRFQTTALSLAILSTLTACGGGGDASPPADTAAPTVAITDNVDAPTATGQILFTFTFNEAVSGFSADDVAVTGGTKGSFSMANDSRSATLVVTPTSGASGTVTVSVAAGAFVDASSNPNTQGASATQDFNTIVSGETGSCLATPCISFSEATVGLGPFGGVAAEVVNDPAMASNKVARLTKPVGAEPWGGATVHLGAADFSLDAVDASQPLTLRVRASEAGIKVMVKIEDAANGAVNVEAQALTTKANEWETLTFSYPAQNSSATYNKISVFPAFFEVNGVAVTERVVYVDELNYTKKPAAPAAPALTFATNFAGAADTTAEGGKWGGYSGGDADGYNCTNGVSFCGIGLNNAVGEPKDRVYYYYVAPLTTTALYSGVYVMAPGLTALNGNVAGLNVSSKTKFSFVFSQNPEWFNSTEKNFGVLFTMSKIYSVGGGSDNCRIQLWQVVTPTSVNDTAYSINLSSFRVLQDCGTGLSTAQALAQETVAQIDFKANAGGTRFGAPEGAAREGGNLQIKNGDNLYPTTIVVKAPLKFE